MKYEYRMDVRDNESLRASFNDLTRKVYGFDFESWYELGQWGPYYIPHVLMDHGKVVSNVSVNRMQFYADGSMRKYIQLGTVMTDPDYRGQGLNRYIIEQVLKEYKDKVDGIYLFANDSVLDYYPQFGFQPSREYVYSMELKEKETVKQYDLKRISLEDSDAIAKLYQSISTVYGTSTTTNVNDGFGMCDNLGLYQFWLYAEYGEMLYYLPEAEAYVIAKVHNGYLELYQVIGEKAVDLMRLAASFEEKVTRVTCYYTPAEQDGFGVNVHKEENTTLFILGEDLKRVESDKLRFPLISHA